MKRTMWTLYRRNKECFRCFLKKGYYMKNLLHGIAQPAVSFLTGSAIVCCIYGADSSPNPPDAVSLRILSPNCIAGMPIIAEVRISSPSGLLPGTYRTNSAYRDSAPLGEKRPHAHVSIDGVRHLLNHKPDSATGVRQCFHDETDTLESVLFNALPQVHHAWISSYTAACSSGVSQ